MFQIKTLFDLKGLPPLVNMLGVEDPKTVTVALDGCYNILNNGFKVSLLIFGSSAGIDSTRWVTTFSWLEDIGREKELSSSNVRLSS